MAEENYYNDAESNDGKDEPGSKKKYAPSREGIREALKLFAYIKPFLPWFILAQVFLAISTLTALAFPGALGQIVGAANGEKTIFNLSLNQILAITLSLLVAQGIFSFLRIVTMAYVTENSVANVRKDLFRKMVLIPMVMNLLILVYLKLSSDLQPCFSLPTCLH